LNERNEHFGKTFKIRIFKGGKAMGRGIVVGGNKISPVVISTICGHWGSGMLPLIFLPEYLFFMVLIRRTETTELVKSSTYSNYRGHFLWYDPRTWRSVQFFGKNSLINAYSHTNLGIYWNVKMMRVSHGLGYRAILNFAPDFSKKTPEVIEEVLFAISTARKILGDIFFAIGIVPSCPNRCHIMAENVRITADCIRAIKIKYPKLAVIVKKALEQPTEAVSEWELAGMDILHGINTVPYHRLFPDRVSPLEDMGGGGISGGMISEIAFQDNCKSRLAVNVPIIFGGGIMTVDDVSRCFEYGGANAVSICTVVRCDTKEAVRIIEKFNA